MQDRTKVDKLVFWATAGIVSGSLVPLLKYHFAEFTLFTKWQSIDTIVTTQYGAPSRLLS